MGPAAVPIASLAITAIGTGVSVAGQMGAAAAQRRQGSYYDRMAEIYGQQAEQIRKNAETTAKANLWNAAYFEDLAGQMAQVGAFNAQAAELDILGIKDRSLNLQGEILDKSRRRQGEQAAGFAKGGVEISGGTPLAVMSETARQAEEAVADVMAQEDLAVAQRALQGQMDQYQAGMEGLNLTHQAAMQRLAAAGARDEGEWRAYMAKLDGWEAMMRGKGARSRASTTEFNAWAGAGMKLGSAAFSSGLFSPGSTTTGQLAWGF